MSAAAQPLVPSTARETVLHPEVVEDSRAVLHKHARSFTLASLFLSRPHRDRAAVVYALCRLIDDTADEATDVRTAEVELARLDRELAGKDDPRPLVAACRALQQSHGVSLDAARELITGVAGDLRPVRVKDDRELWRYCYRVAGTVGLMMCGVLGVTNPRAASYAVDLGLGMQLSNICRDVREDAAMGRVYLPASRLEAHGTTQAALLEGTAPTAAVQAVVRELLALSELCYRRARLGMHFIPWRARVAILVASRVYRAIGRRLLRVHAANPLHGRTVVPLSGRLLAVGAALLSALDPVVLGLTEASDPGADHHRHLLGLLGLPPGPTVAPSSSRAP